MLTERQQAAPQRNKRRTICTKGDNHGPA